MLWRRSTKSPSADALSSTDAIQHFLETLGVVRLEEIIQRVNSKGLQGELVVRGARITISAAAG